MKANKSDIINNITKYIVRQARENGLSYDEIARAVQNARKELGIKKQPNYRKLPRLFSEDELQRFFAAVATDKDPQMELIFRLLLATAVRVGELVNIKVTDFDFNNFTVYINAEKGSFSGKVPFQPELSLPIRQQIARNPESIWLFPSPRKAGKQISTRFVQQKMAYFLKLAGIVDADTGKPWASPHTFRHQTITYLLEKGMPLQKVRKISRHQDINNLMWYEHMQLNIAHEQYHAIMSGKHSGRQ